MNLTTPSKWILFNDNTQPLKKGEGFELRELGSFERIVFRIDLIGDRLAKIGFFQACFVKDTPLKVRLSKNSFPQITLHKVAFAYLAKSHLKFLENHLCKVAAAQLTMIKTKVEKLRITWGEVDPHAFGLEKGDLLQACQLEFDSCQIASFKSALGKALLGQICTHQITSLEQTL